MPEPNPRRPRGLGWTGLIGVTISVVLLWWTLRDVAVADVLSQLRGARILPLIGTVVVATLTFPIRTARWQYLLRDDGKVLPFIPLWHATAIGFMGNNLLPARAGEVARMFVAHRLTKVRFTAAFASVAVERVIDALVLAAMLVLAMWAGGFSADATIGRFALGDLVQRIAVLFGAVLALALVVVQWPAPTLRIVSAGARALLPTRFADRIVAMAEGLLGGLDALRSPRRFFAVLVWTVILWTVNATSFYIGFAAFGIEASWSTAFLLQGIVAFAVALPSAPGFIGVFEAATKVALALYAIDETVAVSYALGYHFATFVPITLLGIWSLAKADIGFRELMGVQTVNAKTSTGST